MFIHPPKGASAGTRRVFARGLIRLGALRVMHVAVFSAVCNSVGPRVQPVFQSDGEELSIVGIGAGEECAQWGEIKDPTLVGVYPIKRPS